MMPTAPYFHLLELFKARQRGLGFRIAGQVM